MNDVFAHTEVLQYLMTVAAALVVVIAAGLVSTAGIKLTVKQAQQVRFYFSQYYPTIRAQVDQPTDRAPQFVDRVLDRVIAADWDKAFSMFAVALIDAANKRIAPPNETVN